MTRREHPNVTMAAVARAAGVSTATVSYVVNGTKAVTPAVQRRVEQAIEHLGYVPSHAAQVLRTGRSFTLGLVLPDLTNPFFPALAQALIEEARAHGYAVILADSHRDEKRQAEAIHNLQQRGADALMIIPVSHTEAPDTGAVPSVILDRPGGAHLSVQSDKYMGGQQAAQHLLDLGHTSFAVLAGPPRHGKPGERVRGMLDTLSAAGVQIPPELFIYSPYSVEDGMAGAQQLLTRGPFTALLCANDTLALGALSTLRQAGHRVGESLSVVGFDDISWAALSNPSLTTVQQDTDEVARTAVRLALQATEAPGHQANCTVPTRLVVRESSGPAPSPIQEEPA